ncbi:MAG: NAD-dependent dehydratase [Betaproteobacteria bacterium HGW-Betaproteobacteria-2]|nr:MAG: NAD-dependent dehydratase [Betaproteobacteria bacterium HGW-Betaproteobacteria-2]
MRDEVDQMKYLLTGASGFVGRALVERLKLHGDIVVEVGRRQSTGSTGCFYQVNDISVDTDFAEAFDGCDAVIHLAARVHVMHDSVTDPLAAFQAVNLHGTVNLARQAAKAGVRRFVYVSSIKVNGEYTGSQPFTEADGPQPQDPYAVSKWQAEQALHEIGRETGMEIVIVRPPLVYGSGVKANFYSLLKLVSKRLPLPLGSIRNRRSMIYVGNLTDALITCATHPAAAGQTYLVSDGEAVSTPQLVKAIAVAMHCPDRVFPFPLSVMRFFASLIGKSSAVDRLTQSLEVGSSKIEKELGWRPPYSMQQGLQVTADWFLQSNDRAGQQNDR